MFLGISTSVWLYMAASLVTGIVAHRAGIVDAILGILGRLKSPTPNQPSGPATPGILANRPVLNHIFNLLTALEPLLSQSVPTSPVSPASPIQPAGPMPQPGVDMLALLQGLGQLLAQVQQPANQPAAPQPPVK